MTGWLGVRWEEQAVSGHVTCDNVLYSVKQSVKAFLIFDFYFVVFVLFLYIYIYFNDLAISRFGGVLEVFLIQQVQRLVRKLKSSKLGF